MWVFCVKKFYCDFGFSSIRLDSIYSKSIVAVDSGSHFESDGLRDPAALHRPVSQVLVPEDSRKIPES